MLLGFISLTNLSAQNVWERTFFSPNDLTAANDVVDLGDSTYMTCGIQRLYPTWTDASLHLAQVDTTGDTLWTRTHKYNGTGNTYGQGITNTYDGNVVVAGYTTTSNGDDDFYLGKFDPAGTLIWEKSEGPNTSERAFSVIETFDSGYAVAGFSFTSPRKAYIIKFDSVGDTLWTQSVPSFAVNAAAYDIVETYDHGLVITGSYDDSLMLAKLSPGGTLQWLQYMTPGAAPSWGCEGWRVKALPDSTYLVAGMFRPQGSVEYRMYYMQTDSLGYPIWEKTLPKSWATDIILNDTGFTLLGHRFHLQPDSGRVWMLNCNSVGDTINTCEFGDVAYWFDSEFGKIQGVPTHDGGIMMANAAHDSAAYTERNFWIAKTDSNGCLSFCNGIGCVWPGDANSDNICNNVDVISLGIAFGNSGPVRSGASLAWTGQPANDWALAFASGPNLKHADCDGNGTVGWPDTMAIQLNYNFTHAKTSGPTGGGAPFYLVPQYDSLQAGDTAYVDVMFGDSLSPVDSLIGVAFSILYDNSLVDSATMKVNFAGSWLGANGTNMITLQKDFFTNGRIDVGMSRNDQTEQMGMGKIAQISFVTVENLSGKTATLFETLYMEPVDVVAMNLTESQKTVSTLGDSIVLYEEQNGVYNPWQGDETAEIKLWPNPTHGKVNLESTNGNPFEVKVFDLSGKLLLQQSSEENLAEVNLYHLPAGCYLLSASASGKTAFFRLLKR